MPSGRPGQTSNPNEINPKFVLRAVLRWWMVALPIGAVFAVVVCGLVWFLHEPVFESRSVVQISETRTSVLTEDSGQARGDSFVQQQLSIIGSPMILSDVLQVPAIAQGNIPELDVEDREAKLNELVQIKTPKGANFHFVTVQARDPKHAQLLCNETMNVYMKYRDREDTRDFNDLISILRAESEEAKSLVRSLKQDYLEMLKESGSTGALIENEGKETSTVNVLTLSDLLIRQAETEIQRSVMVLDIAAEENRIASEPVVVTDREVETLLENDGYIQGLKTAITEVEAKIAQSRYGIEHPSNKDLAEELDQKKQALEEGRMRRRDEIREEQLVLKEKERQNRLEAMKLAHERLGHEIESLQERVDAYEEKVEEEKQETADLAFTRDELQQAEGVVQTLNNRILVAQIENRAPSRVLRLDGDNNQATLPTSPVQAIPMKEMGVAGSLAMFAPFLLAVLWEIRVRRVSDPEQVAAISPLPTIGEIACLPNSRRRRKLPKRIQRQLRQFEESVDGFRTSFLLPRSGTGARVMTITSGVANEGKTTLATQLAMSIGRSTQKRVLLVDADLRSPDVQAMFDLNSEIGLCDVLRGDVSVDDAIATSWDDDLFILPAGRLKGDSPHRLVSDGNIGSLFEELREKFDYIVVDTSPVLCSSEALMIGQVSDDVVVSVMRDFSRVEHVKRVQERFKLADIELAGCVVSGIQQSKYAYSYGYYEAANA